MGTILVLTGRDDLTADAVIDELAPRNASVVRYDTADFPLSSQLAVSLGPNGWDGELTGERAIDLDTVSAVWWRRPAEFRVPTGWPDEARAFALSEARVGILGVLGSLPVRWINHPAKDSAANYKPVQLAVAARAGLEVPRTVITSDPDHARASSAAMRSSTRASAAVCSPRIDAIAICRRRCCGLARLMMR